MVPTTSSQEGSESEKENKRTRGDKKEGGGGRRSRRDVDKATASYCMSSHPGEWEETEFVEEGRVETPIKTGKGRDACLMCLLVLVPTYLRSTGQPNLKQREGGRRPLPATASGSVWDGVSALAGVRPPSGSNEGHIIIMHYPWPAWTVNIGGGAACCARCELSLLATSRPGKGERAQVKAHANGGQGRIAAGCFGRWFVSCCIPMLLGAGWR